MAHQKARMEFFVRSCIGLRSRADIVSEREFHASRSQAQTGKLEVFRLPNRRNHGPRGSGCPIQNHVLVREHALGENRRIENAGLFKRPRRGLNDGRGPRWRSTLELCREFAVRRILQFHLEYREHVASRVRISGNAMIVADRSGQCSNAECDQRAAPGISCDAVARYRNSTSWINRNYVYNPVFGGVPER